MSGDSTYNDTRRLMKAIAWERAKGALREVVICEGMQWTGGLNGLHLDKLIEHVEGFIKNFEYEGFHE